MEFYGLTSYQKWVGSKLTNYLDIFLVLLEFQNKYTKHRALFSADNLSQQAFLRKLVFICSYCPKECCSYPHVDGRVHTYRGITLQTPTVPLTLSSRKHTYTILTPLTHFYILKLGFTGVYTIFSYFCSKNIECGYSLEPPRRGGSNKNPQSVF